MTLEIPHLKDTTICARQLLYQAKILNTTHILEFTLMLQNL